MNLLALDTSSLACAAGARFGEKLAIRHEERPREHTRILMPMLRDVLDDAGLSVGELDAVVLGNGPGSFIGMRIASSVAQGIAFGAGIPVVPVSSLAAVAAAAGAPAETVVVTQDAHMQQVYLGIYQIGADGLPTSLMPERLQPQQEIDELRNYPDAIAAGAGWQRYPALLDANNDRLGSVSEVLYPSAGPLLALGAAAYRAGRAIAADDVDPAYLRSKVAQKPRPVTP